MSPNTHMIVSLVISLLTGLWFTLLGIVTLFRGPRVDYLRNWRRFCLAFGFFAAFLALANLVKPGALGLAVVRAGLSCGALASFMFFEFTLSFSGSTRRLRRLHQVAVVWLGALLLLFWATRLLIADVVSSQFSQSAPKAGPMIPFYLAYVIFTWGTPLVLIISSFRTAKGLKRTQFAYLLVAFIIGAMAALGSLLPATLGSQTTLAFLPALFWPVFPFVITYGIVRHRLWDVRTIIHRTAVWAGLLLSLLIPLFLLLRAVAGLHETISHGEFAAVLLASVVLSHVFLRFAKPRIDHMFQRGSFISSAVIEEFVRSTVGVYQPTELTRLVRDVLNRTLYPTSVAVHLVDREKRWRPIAGPDGAVPIDLTEFHELLRTLAAFPSAIDQGQVDSDSYLSPFSTRLNQLFQNLNAQVLLPLVHGSEPIGVVAIGSKRNLRAYNRADLEFLDAIAAELSKSFTNAVLFQEVDHQRTRLAELAASLEQRVQERTLELEQVNTSLKDLNRYRSHFFANITHELRTPLTMILAPIEDLMSSTAAPLNPTQQNYLSTVRRNALRLFKLINNLLDLAKLEEKRLQLHPERTDLVGLLQQIADQAKPLAARKGIALKLQLASGLEPIYADVEQMERVIVNLLANALKFTNSGGEVAITLAPTTDGVEILITDNGIGIAPDKFDHIFERFGQADESTTRRFGGTGLGLAFAKELVELHKGSISVESELGKGSTFRIRLLAGTEHLGEDFQDSEDSAARGQGFEEREPREWTRKVLELDDYRFLEVSEATERRRVARATSDAVGKPKVLVVEDNVDVLRFIHMQLASSYTVYVAQDGQSGCELATRELPDLIVTDYMMPTMDGLQLITKLRGQPSTADIPIVMLTAKSGVEDRVGALQRGADVYLTKPFSPAELRTIVEQLLARRGKQVQQLMQSQVKSVETISAGLAHEIYNPLSYLKSAVSIISERSQRLAKIAVQRGEFDAEIKDQVEKERQRIERMSSIAHRGIARIEQIGELLRRVAREGYPSDVIDMDFDAAVRDVIELVAPKDGSRIEVGLQLNASKVRVRCVQVDMHQVIRNLIQNALDAASSRIMVMTEVVEDFLHFSVDDDGAGVSPDLRARIFAPFFTTKSPGQGMGLGLSIVHQVLLNASGSIEVGSSPWATGARFSVRLPAMPAPLAAFVRRITEQVGADADPAS